MNLLDIWVKCHLDSRQCCWEHLLLSSNESLSFSPVKSVVSESVENSMYLASCNKGVSWGPVVQFHHLSSWSQDRTNRGRYLSRTQRSAWGRNIEDKETMLFFWWLLIFKELLNFNIFVLRRLSLSKVLYRQSSLDSPSLLSSGRHHLSEDNHPDIDFDILVILITVLPSSSWRIE